MKPNHNIQSADNVIYPVKTFVNELEMVQEQYFNKLASDLNLTKKGEEFLFDYVYNDSGESKNFSQFLHAFGIKFEDLLVCQQTTGSEDTFVFTDFGDYTPMIPMNSCGPDLKTSFPTAFSSTTFDKNEQASSDFLR